VDLRGHGDSAWDPSPAPSYGYKRHAADVNELAEKLDLRDFILIGHSMGGMIGSIYTATYPGRAKAFMLVDTTIKMTPERLAGFSAISNREGRHYATQEEFIANYSDGLTDLPLPDQLAHFRQMKAVGSFVSVAPRLSYHMVTAGENGLVSGVEEMSRSSLRINGGYMLFTAAIFDFMQPGEELVQEPFQRLIKEQKLVGYRYDGFWASMDTFKDKQVLDEMYAKDRAPWIIWKQTGGSG